MSNFDQFPQLWCGVEWCDVPGAELRDEKFFPSVIVLLAPDADGDNVSAALDVLPVNCRDAFHQPEKVAAFFERWEKYAQEHRYPFEFNDQIYQRTMAGGLVLRLRSGQSEGDHHA
jgi:hypothetical protein